MEPKRTPQVTPIEVHGVTVAAKGEGLGSNPQLLKLPLGTRHLVMKKPKLDSEVQRYWLDRLEPNSTSEAGLYSSEVYYQQHTQGCMRVSTTRGDLGIC